MSLTGSIVGKEGPWWSTSIGNQTACLGSIRVTSFPLPERLRPPGFRVLPAAACKPRLLAATLIEPAVSPLVGALGYVFSHLYLLYLYMKSK